MNCTAHKPQKLKGLPTVLVSNPMWLRGVDLNHRPLGYEPNELPDCSTPHKNHISGVEQGQTRGTAGSWLNLDFHRRNDAIQPLPNSSFMPSFARDGYVLDSGRPKI